MKNLSKVLALCLAMVLTLGLAAGAASVFTDIRNDSDVTSAQKLAIDTLGALDMSAGDGSGNFNPHKVLTRQEAVTFIFNAINGGGESAAKLYENYSTKFTDVSGDSSWAKGYIGWAVSKNITSGTGNNKFSPLDNLTLIQAIAMIMNAQGIEMSKENITDWDVAQDKYFELAADAGLLKNLSGTALNSQVTRAQMALLVYNSLSVGKYSYSVNFDQVVGGNSVQGWKREYSETRSYKSLNGLVLTEGTISANDKFAVDNGTAADTDKSTFSYTEDGASKTAKGPAVDLSYVGRSVKAIKIDGSIKGYSLTESNEIITTADKVSFDSSVATNAKINFGNGSKDYSGRTIKMYINYESTATTVDTAKHTGTGESNEYDGIVALKNALSNNDGELICLTDSNGYVTTIFRIQKTFVQVSNLRTDTITIGSNYNVSKSNIIGDISALVADDWVLYYKNVATGKYYVTPATVLKSIKAVFTGTTMTVNDTSYKPSNANTRNGASLPDASEIGKNYQNKTATYYVVGGYYYKASAASSSSNVAIITKAPTTSTYRNGANGSLSVDLLTSSGEKLTNMYVDVFKYGAAGTTGTDPEHWNLNATVGTIVTYSYVSDNVIDMKIAYSIDNNDSSGNPLPNRVDIAADNTNGLVKSPTTAVIDGSTRYIIDSDSKIFIKVGDASYRVASYSSDLLNKTAAFSAVSSIFHKVSSSTGADRVTYGVLKFSTIEGTSVGYNYAVVSGDVKWEADNIVIPVWLKTGETANLTWSNTTSNANSISNLNLSKGVVINISIDNYVLQSAPKKLTSNGNAALATSVNLLFETAVAYSTSSSAVLVRENKLGTVSEANYTATGNSDIVYLSSFDGEIIYKTKDTTGYPKAELDGNSCFKKNVTIVFKAAAVGKTWDEIFYNYPDSNTNINTYVAAIIFE